jgi:hypothetical protein
MDGLLGRAEQMRFERVADVKVSDERANKSSRERERGRESEGGGRRGLFVRLTKEEDRQVKLDAGTRGEFASADRTKRLRLRVICNDDDQLCRSTEAEVKGETSLFN